MSKPIAWTCLLFACAPLIRGQVLETKKGPVEFIGLEEWTPQGIHEKLGYGEDPHYCAADLKKAGFPDASVVIHVADDKSWYTVVTIVEPKRAADVMYRAAPAGDLPMPAAWDAIRHADRPKREKAAKTLAADSDYRAALAILRDAKEWEHRATAALVLANFGDRDGAWYALVGGLRDPDDRVSGACSHSLYILRVQAPRNVDWTPATADLAAVLHGTNLFAFGELTRTLAATKIDPAMATALLGHGGARLLLAKLRAKQPEEHDTVHRLLVQLHGVDLGDKPEPWEAWLATI